jgi:hypothetical protein
MIREGSPVAQVFGGRYIRLASPEMSPSMWLAYPTVYSAHYPCELREKSMQSESRFMFVNERATIPQRHGSHRIAYIESLEGSAIDDKT